LSVTGSCAGILPRASAFTTSAGNITYTGWSGARNTFMASAHPLPAAQSNSLGGGITAAATVSDFMPRSRVLASRVGRVVVAGGGTSARSFARALVAGPKPPA
jgi:hypothetical protein